MVNKDKVMQGHKITKSFEGAQFEEIQNLREAVEMLLSKLDNNSLTEEEINKKNKFETYNSKVKEKKNK